MRTVLAIDDDLGVLRLIRKILGERYAVAVASDADGGRSVARRVSPSVILVDRYLTAGDGLQLVTEMRREHPRAALILMSSALGMEIVSDATSAGAHAFLGKEELHLAPRLLARLSR